MTAIAKTADHPRPLKVLSALIKEQWEEAQQAAARATQPYYVAIGEMLIEAKAQMPHGEFIPWVEQNFDFGERQARKYMQVITATRDMQIGTRASGLSDALRDIGTEPRGHARSGAGPSGWRAPVQEKLISINFGRFSQAQLKREAEEKLVSKLIVDCFDIGYKVLATKMHPDRPGGSHEAMSRLNAARKRIRDLYHV